MDTPTHLSEKDLFRECYTEVMASLIAVLRMAQEKGIAISADCIHALEVNLFNDRDNWDRDYARLVLIMNNELLRPEFLQDPGKAGICQAAIVTLLKHPVPVLQDLGRSLAGVIVEQQVVELKRAAATKMGDLLPVQQLAEDTTWEMVDGPMPQRG